MRLAHASDLHLLSLGGARLLDFANKRWIGGLNLLANRGRHHRPEIFEAMIEDLNAGTADHLVVTGDLTNLALPDEFRFARGLFDRLALGPGQVTVVPGNHDAYVKDGVRHFAAEFAPFAASDPGWAWPDGEPWPVVRVHGPVALIGLSTSHQTPWFTAYGRVGDEQLARLRAALVDPRLAGLCRVVLIHHPPAGPWAESVVRGLKDRARLAEVLAEAGAELVLHGHEHRDLTSSLAGPDGAIPVRGIQSGTYEAGRLDRRARYRILTIEPATDGGRARVVDVALRVFDPGAGRFVAEATPPRLVAAG
jgi:3',5'-cyclic AMP phosphodiesterase CpdA